jgi:hypothetical protein
MVFGAQDENTLHLASGELCQDASVTVLDCGVARVLRLRCVVTAVTCVYRIVCSYQQRGHTGSVSERVSQSSV